MTKRKPDPLDTYIAERLALTQSHDTPDRLAALLRSLDDAIYDAAVLRTESVRLNAADARALRAALVSEGGLDVERLIDSVPLGTIGYEPGDTTPREAAEFIATEYARLATPTEEPTDE